MSSYVFETASGGMCLKHQFVEPQLIEKATLLFLFPVAVQIIPDLKINHKSTLRSC